MSEIIRISVIAVLVILLTMPLKQQIPHFSVLMGVGLGLLILTVTLGRLKNIWGVLEQLKQYVGVGGGYLNILLKVLGITYVCDFAASICRDAGHGFVAGQLEFLGKLSVMVSGISVLFILLEQMNHLA